uniref:NADH-ubiquinone oxidoreductase chain 2 n=1 Tax=Quadristernoseta cf. longigynium XFX-2019 TaxID=2695872 RepID=A0A6B9WD68_9ACAR|nr:NADH dehydrogenase subunit 2 [Quadristernoseta cf. longigynium XFX-2019]
MKKMTKNFSFLILIMSIIMAVNMNNYFYMWIILEINMISFIPIMMMDKKTSTNMMKYFIVQSLASSMFFLSIIMEYFMNFSSMGNNILLVSMMMKLGASPFHTWLPQVSELLSWNSVMILLTLQKFIPLYMVSMNKSNIIFMSIILSAIFGSMGLFSQKSLRKLMAFSSISHLAWMMYTLFSEFSSWLYYFTVYFLVSITVIMNINIFNLKTISNIKSMTDLQTIIFFSISMMSLAGMPPLLGFFPKWMAIMNSPNINILLCLLIMSSLVNMYIYMKLIFPLMLIKNNFNKNKKNFYPTILINMMLPLMIPFTM